MCAAAAFVGIDVVLDRSMMGNGRSSSSSTRSTRPRRLQLAVLVERAARHDLRGARPLRRRAAAHRSSSSTTQILAATIERHQTISGVENTMLFKRGVKARRPRLDLRGAHHRLTRVGGVCHLPADQADERAAPRPVDDAGAAWTGLSVLGRFGVCFRVFV